MVNIFFPGIQVTLASELLVLKLTGDPVCCQIQQDDIRLLNLCSAVNRQVKKLWTLKKLLLNLYFNLILVII